MNTIREPVIKQALATKWDQLADIVKKHYDLPPGTASHITIKGTMKEIYRSTIALPFLIPGRAIGALVPYSGTNIAVTVRNWTTPDNSQAMFWHRTFNFPNKPPVVFSSRMEYAGNSEIIEFVRLGFGIRISLSVRDGALVIKSLGYILHTPVINISIPNWLLLGNAEITEKAISDHEFEIDFKIVHPLFGKTFGYSGRFHIEAN